MGEMSSEATHPSVTAAEMTREVRVAHRQFPDGGLVIPSLPICEGRRTLRLYERLSCWRCVDLMCRCKQRDNGPRIERLEKRLYRGAPRALLSSAARCRARPASRREKLASSRAAALDKYQGSGSRPRGNVCLIRLRANP
jgi:hypothetical protein